MDQIIKSWVTEFFLKKHKLSLIIQIHLWYYQRNEIKYLSRPQFIFAKPSINRALIYFSDTPRDLYASMRNKYPKLIANKCNIKEPNKKGKKIIKKPKCRKFQGQKKKTQFK